MRLISVAPVFPGAARLQPYRLMLAPSARTLPSPSHADAVPLRDLLLTHSLPSSNRPAEPCESSEIDVILIPHSWAHFVVRARTSAADSCAPSYRIVFPPGTI